MFNKISIILLVCASFSYGAASSAPQLTSPEIQYERFLALKSTRGVDAPFPELLEQFEENSHAVSHYLNDALTVQFKTVYDLARSLFGEGGKDLTLRLYNQTNHAFSALLSISQGDPMIKDHEDTLSITNNILDDMKILETMRLYSYTIFSLTGHFELKTINDSVAHDVRIVGIPLKRSSYDVYKDRTSTDFELHDWGHVSTDIFQPHSKITCDQLQLNLAPYRKLMRLIAENGDDPLDHTCLFILEHERYMFSRSEGTFTEACDHIAKKCTELFAVIELYHLIITASKESAYPIVIEDPKKALFAIGTALIEFKARYEKKMKIKSKGFFSKIFGRK